MTKQSAVVSKESDPVRIVKPEFWVETIKSLGVPVVGMAVMMAGFWQATQSGLVMAERFVSRAIAQMDEQADVLRRINENVTNNGAMIESISSANERLLQLHSEILDEQKESSATLRRIETANEK